jgi:hypothetical protein
METTVRLLGEQSLVPTLFLAQVQASGSDKRLSAVYYPLCRHYEIQNCCISILGNPTACLQCSWDHYHICGHLVDGWD